MKANKWSTDRIMLLVILGLAVFAAIGYAQGNQAVTIWLIFTLPVIAFTWVIVRNIERSFAKKNKIQMSSTEVNKLNKQTFILLLVAIAIVLGSFII